MNRCCRNGAIGVDEVVSSVTVHVETSEKAFYVVLEGSQAGHVRFEDMSVELKMTRYANFHIS